MGHNFSLQVRKLILKIIKVFHLADKQFVKYGSIDNLKPKFTDVQSGKTSREK